MASNSLLTTLRNLVSRIAGALSWLPPTLARLTLGYVFVESGWGKLHRLPQVVEYFRSLGIPAPELQAPFAAGTELVCGALLIVGLLSRIASVPLIVTMVVAIATAKVKELAEAQPPQTLGLSELFGFIEYLYIALLLWIGVAGPGPLSLDHVLSKKLFGDSDARS